MGQQHNQHQQVFERQEEQLEVLTDTGVDITPSQMVNTTVSLIYRSGICTEADMKEWESKAQVDKTWPNMKKYFRGIYKARVMLQSQVASAADLGYGSEGINALREEIEQERKALEAQKCQFAEILKSFTEKKQAPATKTPAEDANQVVTKALTDLTTIVQSLSDEVQSLKKDEAGTKTGKPKAPKHKCPECEMMVRHKLANCPDKEENKDKRWSGWKPKAERIRLGLQEA